MLVLRARDLLVASWAVSRESVARTLPPGLEPAEVDGRQLVSIVCLRYGGGRLGPLPAPRFSQLNVRVYARWQDETAVVFLDARVTLPGMAATLLGAPFRTTRLRFRRGRADAPGLGVRLRYEVDGETDPGDLGRHELGLFESAGLRGFRVRRRPCTWRRAVLTEPARADPLLALGFDVGEPVSLLYAEEAWFEVEARPRRMTSTRSSGSSR